MDVERHRQIIGNRIRLALEGLGVSYSEAAAATGIDKSRLGHWCRGKHYPDPQWIEVFDKRYGISADWIYLERSSALPRNLADYLSQAAKGSAQKEGSQRPPGGETD
jgi:transcriptional regulator with XRE-family HTH domain